MRPALRCQQRQRALSTSGRAFSQPIRDLTLLWHPYFASALPGVTVWHELTTISPFLAWPSLFSSFAFPFSSLVFSCLLSATRAGHAPRREGAGQEQLVRHRRDQDRHRRRRTRPPGEHQEHRGKRRPVTLEGGVGRNQGACVRAWRGVAWCFCQAPGSRAKSCREQFRFSFRPPAAPPPLCFYPTTAADDAMMMQR